MYSEASLFFPNQFDSEGNFNAVMLRDQTSFSENSVSRQCHYILKSNSATDHAESIGGIIRIRNYGSDITSFTFGMISLEGYVNYCNGSVADLLLCCLNRTLVVRIPCMDRWTREGKRNLKMVERFLKNMEACKEYIQVIFIDPYNTWVLERMIDDIMPNTPLGIVSNALDVMYRNISSDKYPFGNISEIRSSPGKLFCFSQEEDELQTRKRRKPSVKQEISDDVDYYRELMEIIGLQEAKRVAELVVNYDLASKTLADKGFKRGSISMHMAFLGNPGTAKTTVARMMAAAFKQKGVLKTGNFVEVGRGDLVGKHVGHTADIVKRRFKEAKGGVLFIDEAYSLCGDLESFGGEAITTIVQEMENNRNDTLVIFAGYPDLMEDFIDSNPGLRSRVQFKIPFPDYTTEELCRIADYLADKLGVKLDDEAHTKLKELLESAKEGKDFGNGRLVRNIIELAKLEQAKRLMSDLSKIQDLTEDDVKTITAADLVFDVQVEQKKKYGFVI